MDNKKTLASWLTREYEIKGTKVVSKKIYKIEYKGKVYELPENYVWILANSKRGTDMIVSCTPIITYAGCLALQEYFQINFSETEFKQEIIKDHPAGYTVIVYASGGCLPVPIIGEANTNSLQTSMHTYLFTMAWKRAIARGILQATGLYSQGFYSDAELGGSFGIQEEIHTTEENKKEENKKEDIIEDVAKHIMKDMYEKVKKILVDQKAPTSRVYNSLQILAKYYKKDKHKNPIHLLNSFLKYSTSEVRVDMGEEVMNIIYALTNNRQGETHDSKEPLKAYEEVMAREYFETVVPSLYPTMDSVFFGVMAVNINNYYKTHGIPMYNFSDAGLYLSKMAEFCNTDPLKLTKILINTKHILDNGLFDVVNIKKEVKDFNDNSLIGGIK